MTKSATELADEYARRKQDQDIGKKPIWGSLAIYATWRDYQDEDPIQSYTRCTVQTDREGLLIVYSEGRAEMVSTSHFVSVIFTPDEG